MDCFRFLSQPSSTETSDAELLKYMTKKDFIFSYFKHNNTNNMEKSEYQTHTQSDLFDRVRIITWKKTFVGVGAWIHSTEFYVPRVLSSKNQFPFVGNNNVEDTKNTKNP